MKEAHLRQTRSENRNSRDNSQSSLRTDEELLEIVTYASHQSTTTEQSETINSPVLSFLSAPARPPGIPTLITVPFPSAKTASIPNTVPCNDPYLNNRSPPAFVERFPAM